MNGTRLSIAPFIKKALFNDAKRGTYTIATVTCTGLAVDLLKDVLDQVEGEALVQQRVGLQLVTHRVHPVLALGIRHVTRIPLSSTEATLHP